MMAKPVLRVVPRLDTVEEVTDATDKWLRGDCTREFKIRTTTIGTICILFERGRELVRAGGQGAVDAIANALEAFS